MGQDILVSGRIDMNRAMEGDVVAGGPAAYTLKCTAVLRAVRLPRVLLLVLRSCCCMCRWVADSIAVPVPRAPCCWLCCS